MAYPVRDSYLPFIFAGADALHRITDKDKATDRVLLPVMVVPVLMVVDSLSRPPLVPLPAPTLSTFFSLFTTFRDRGPKIAIC